MKTPANTRAITVPMFILFISLNIKIIAQLKAEIKLQVLISLNIEYNNIKANSLNIISTV